MSTSDETDMAPDATSNDQKWGDRLFGWTSHKNTGNYVFIGVSVLCVLLFLADFLIHRHEYIHTAEFPAFYALFGFVAFAGVVVSGWPLRRLLGRSENYYEPEDQ